MELSEERRVAEYLLGKTVARFEISASEMVSLSLIPQSCAGKVEAPREQVDGIEREVITRKIASLAGHVAESCVQLKLRGDAGPKAFSQGRSMRGGPAVESLRFDRQEVLRDGRGLTEIVTRLIGGGGQYACRLHLCHRAEAPYLQAWTVFENLSAEPLTLEMLSSFCLDGITPFHRAAAPEQVRVHRFRSVWAAEGRHEAMFLEDLHLERSWAGYGAFSERFGQMGSMPVRGFFPWLGMEDTQAGVFWGAQLAHPGSWQMEVYRRHDKVSISGGLADREFGHWWKSVGPGESFSTPVATLACVEGGLEALCGALLKAQDDAAPPQAGEEDLPIIFNEWCSTWGNPSHDNVIATADILSRTRTRYLVIDDGWAERPGDQFQQNGDWIVNRKAFPEGLKATCDAVRARGLVPGVWFEFEVCNDGSKAFAETDHHLRRDGAVLQIGTRRFWDFRDPWVSEYLGERVIRMLRENGFGYLKVDYNETLGLGCDESGAAAPGAPGEGLRQHLEAVQAFFRRIREEVPGIVIENCSSGGHRLEPSMQALTSMGSFSDAHESVEIPIIAASLQQLILPRQSQIWAVLKLEDSVPRLRYLLSATFLGRMCISGDVMNFNDGQVAELAAAQEFYTRAVPVIRSGASRIHRAMGRSWRTPQGWQAVVRAGTSDAAGRALVVVHVFENPPPVIEVPLAEAGRVVLERYNLSQEAFSIVDGVLRLEGLPAWTGCALLLGT